MAIKSFGGILATGVLLFSAGVLALIVGYMIYSAGIAKDNTTELYQYSEPAVTNEEIKEVWLNDNYQLPEGFVYLDQVVPMLLEDIRYWGYDNFIGRPIAGYGAPKAIMTIEAALALKKMQLELLEEGMSIKVYDAYRPQQAVEDFVNWAKDPNNQLMKEQYYPNVNKNDLFKQGYISSRSAHSRGSTIDLTLVDLTTGEKLDMGSDFDFLDPLSHHDSPLITKEQLANRNLLRAKMKKHGFREYHKEWWHYTFINEPYPKDFFNFEVK